MYSKKFKAMEQREDILDIVRLFWNWRKPILGLSLLVGVLTAVFSLVLPNYYRATTVFVAANPNQARPEILFGKANSSVEFYGSDEDMDRLLAIAASNELVDYLVDSFDLFEHYQIDANHPKASYKVRMHFRKLYEVKKTKLNVLELSVEDQDPALAAAIANAARNQINTIAEGLVKAAQTAMLLSNEGNIQSKLGQLKVLGDSLEALRAEYQIYNTAEQSERLTEQMVTSQSLYYRSKGRLESMRSNPRISRDSVAYAEALVNGLRQEIDSLSNQLNRLNQGQVVIGILENQYFSANGGFGEDVERAKLLRATLAAEIPTIILVEAAEVPVVKSRPKRSFFVLGAVLLTFLLSMFAVLLIHTYRNTDFSQLLKAE